MHSVLKEGRHRKQSAFVVEGRGYTINNGVRHDWGKEELMFMPLNPDGNEHQHFNVDPNVPSEFVTFFF